MKWNGHLNAVILSLLIAACPAYSQSTSAWVHVSSDRPAGSAGILGASYVSMTVLKVSVYNKSNWWTRLVEKNRSALATITISGSLSGGKSIQDKRVSAPIDLRQDAANIDFGWSQAILNDMPVNYTSLQVEIGVAKTAQDGVDKLISVANDISVKAPLLSASTATLGTVSAAKMIADVIFDKQLAAERLKSTSPLTATQDGILLPGVYIALAADTAAQYDAYISGGGKDLNWDDGSHVLTYKGKSINGLSYFVVDVAYKPSVYGLATLASAPLTSDKPWARLYRSALTTVDNISDLNKLTDVRNAVATVKADAEQLLNEDADFVQSERAAIQGAIRDELNRRLIARYQLLKSNTNPGGPVLLSLTDMRSIELQ